MQAARKALIPLQSSAVQEDTLLPTGPETAPPVEAPAAAIDRVEPEFEGDYRPAAATYLDPINARIEPSDYQYLLRLAEALKQHA